MKRTIEVSTRGLHLSLRDRQLVIAAPDAVLARVPFEDLGVLILDSTALTVTTAALTAAVDSGSAVVLCGDDHHPRGLLLPISANTLQAERLAAQVRSGLPLTKNLWKEIVRAKIRNQGVLLPRGTSGRQLRILANKVLSGDSGNLEARAARIYWAGLFSRVENPDLDFPFHRRRDGPPPNNLLNYGYMVLRAAMARAVCAAGLAPGLGLHHHNRYNPFCLADDLMEPFRPWVDGRVLEMVGTGILEIEKESKRFLLEVLTDTVRIGNEEGPLFHAMERTASSLALIFLKEGKDKDDSGRIPAAELARRLVLPAFQDGETSAKEPC